MTKPTQYPHVYSVTAGETVEGWVAPCEGYIWFDEAGLLGCREVYPTAESAQADLKGYVDTVLSPSHTPKAFFRVIKMTDKVGGFVKLEDGFVYCDFCNLRGCFSAQNLRDLADELDRRNAEWQAVVESELRSRVVRTMEDCK